MPSGSSGHARRCAPNLGRTIRDIARQVASDDELAAFFARPLGLARRLLDQKQRLRRPKVYSLQVPEVECIGKG